MDDVGDEFEYGEVRFCHSCMSLTWHVFGQCEWSDIHGDDEECLTTVHKLLNGSIAVR